MGGGGTHGGFRIQISLLSLPLAPRNRGCVGSRAEVDLQMLLDLVVELRRQTAHASLAGPDFATATATPWRRAKITS